MNLAGAEGTAPGQPIKGTLRLSPERTGDHKPLEAAVEIPGESTVDLAPGMTWQARFEAEGFWGEPQAVLPEKAGETLDLRVFPAASLRGKIVPPRGEEKAIPADLSVRFQFAPLTVKGKPLDATIACPIRDSKLDCAVPAGIFDLRLRAEAGFAPLYLWGIRLDAGKTTDLGELRLLRGASVSGWIETETGKPASSGCRVTLKPESAGEAESIATLDRLERLTLETSPNERGFFQFTGVPPGRYLLTAAQDGFAPASLTPVDVRPGLEAQVIERLVLAKPVSFEVAFDPPGDPYGRPWRIELARRSDPYETARETFRGQASAEGIWKTLRVPPGTYELMVLGEAETSFWLREFVEVEPGMPPLHIDIPVLRVKGILRIGREPLAATLWLSRKSGPRIRFDSDAEGRFSGVLPEEGIWTAALASDDIRVRIPLEPVEVKLPKGKTVAEIEIVIPDTRLAGQVVDEAGRPLVDATVQITSLEKPRIATHVRSDEKGEFSIRGLPSGNALVDASHPEGESDFSHVSIPEDTEAPWLQIVIRKLQKVEGRIVSPLGGVPGARILASSPFNGKESTRVADDVSGPDGRFSLRISRGAPFLNVVVFPPGLALRMTTVPVIPGQPLEISVAPEGRTLVIEGSAEDGPTPLLVHGGMFAFPEMLAGWLRMQGARPSPPGRMVIPNIEPGAYSLCQGAAAISRLREGQEPPAASCVSGVLTPHGELVLRAPLAKPAR